MLAGAWILVAACASRGPATAPVIPPGTGNMFEANIPPPKGLVQPRLADTPPPQPIEDEVQGSPERYLINENDDFQRRRRMSADARPVPAVEAYPMGTGTGQPATDPEACVDVPAPERSACPLRAPGPVQAITDLPDGVRVTYRKTRKLTAERVYRLTECQRAVEQVNPPPTPSCAFVEPGTDIAVSEQRGRIVIDLRRPPGAGGVDLLRTAVRTALGARR